MFSGSLLSTASLAAAAASAFMSPSKSGKVKVSSTTYRNDPYRVRVTPVTPQYVSFAAPAALYEAPPSPAFVAEAMPMYTQQSQDADTIVDAPVEHWARVSFKRESAMYKAPFRVAIGDCVVVEADRGENYGFVAEVTCEAPTFNVPSSIIRRSTPYDDAIRSQYADREETTTTAIQRLSESLGLGIRIVDSEFQLDGNKLTIFFSSRVFVDFRKLQRSLFREHRCRIWLVNANEIQASVPRLC